MKLIDDWKTKFPKLWSVRFALLSAVLSAGEVWLNLYATGQPPTFATAAFIASLLSAMARIIAQPELSK